MMYFRYLKFYELFTFEIKYGVNINKIYIITIGKSPILVFIF